MDNEESVEVKENKKYYIKVGKKCLLVIIAAVLLIVAFKFAIFLLPFAIALIINKLMSPLVTLMTEKLKFSYKVSIIISVILAVLIIGSIVTFSVIKLTDEIYDLTVALPSYVSSISETATLVLAEVEKVFKDLPEPITTQYYATVNNIGTKLIERAANIANSLVSGVIALPTVFIYTIITILATLFIGLDKEYIKKTFIHQLPDAWSEKVFTVSKDIFSALGAYIKSVFTIILITFGELLIGFTTLTLLGFKVPYVFAIATFVAFIDALPILGCGTVLIPWAVFCALTGDINFAIALFIMYLVITIIRNLIEPKIVSQNIGVHPIITLLAMYIGFKFFGLIGFIFGPITIFILKGIFAKQLEKGFFRDIFQK